MNNATVSLLNWSFIDGIHPWRGSQSFVQADQLLFRQHQPNPSPSPPQHQSSSSRPLQRAPKWRFIRWCANIDYARASWNHICGATHSIICAGWKGTVFHYYNNKKRSGFYVFNVIFMLCEAWYCFVTTMRLFFMIFIIFIFCLHWIVVSTAWSNVKYSRTRCSHACLIARMKSYARASPKAVVLAMPPCTCLQCMVFFFTIQDCNFH